MSRLLIGVVAACLLAIGCTEESTPSPTPTESPAATTSPTSAPAALPTTAGSPAPQIDPYAPPDPTETPTPTATTSAPAGTPTSAPTAAPAPQARASVIQGFALESMTIPAGTTVTWTNADSAPHTATADNGAFDSGTLSAQAFSHTFAAAGVFDYHCRIHTGMRATITVQ